MVPTVSVYVLSSLDISDHWSFDVADDDRIITKQSGFIGIYANNFDGRTVNLSLSWH